MEPTQLQKLFGEQLKQLRHHKNLKQQKLGELSDTKTATICNIENGKGNPKLKTLCKIAAALDAEIVLEIRRK